MKLGIFITKDVIVGEGMRNLMLHENAGTAKRAWGNAIEQCIESGNKEKIPVNDLQLFQIGVLDTETLKIEPKEEFIANGAEFNIKKEI